LPHALAASAKGKQRFAAVERPLLIIVNGLPASGKTTLSKRLGQDLHLPVFSRDGIYETLFDALSQDPMSTSPLMGSAAFSLFYYVIGSVLAAQQPVIIEQFFGHPELRTAELVELQHRYDFEPFQILCKADGNVLVERFLARVASGDRHAGQAGLEWVEQNRERLLMAVLPPLALDGHLVEVDTTTSDTFDYDTLLRQVQSALS
jgi:predicted kinase